MSQTIPTATNLSNLSREPAERKRLLEKVITPALSAVLALAVSYIGVLTAQTSTAAKITTIEKSMDNDRAAAKEALRESEQRIRGDVGEVKTDIRDLQRGQTEMLRILTNREPR